MNSNDIEDHPSNFEMVDSKCCGCIFMNCRKGAKDEVLTTVNQKFKLSGRTRENVFQQFSPRMVHDVSAERIPFSIVFQPSSALSAKKEGPSIR